MHVEDKINTIKFKYWQTVVMSNNPKNSPKPLFRIQIYVPAVVVVVVVEAHKHFKAITP